MSENDEYDKIMKQYEDVMRMIMEDKTSKELKELKAKWAKVLQDVAAEATGKRCVDFAMVLPDLTNIKFGNFNYKNTAEMIETLDIVFKAYAKSYCKNMLNSTDEAVIQRVYSILIERIFPSNEKPGEEPFADNEIG